MKRRTVLLGVVAVLGAAGLGFALERPAGYGVTVDYRAVLGPPPAPDSAEARAERAGFAASAAGIGSPRWRLASSQVYANSPEVMAQLSCAVGRRITPATTPVTAQLLARVAADVRGPFDAAKAYYHRDRPYVGTGDTRTCDPRTLGSLGGATGGALSYAYPSGHAAYGEIWGRTLAAALPDRAAAAMAWGVSLGDNRVVCRVHWPSDVAAGRRLADAVHDRLAALPAFRADVAAARAELARAPAATGCAGPAAAATTASP